MSSKQLLQKPDIKLSVKQTFGFDSDINLTKILHLQYWLASHLIKEF